MRRMSCRCCVEGSCRRCSAGARRTAAAAQDYPTKPVRIIVPFPPGAINDTVGRMVANHLSNRLGKQFVVENRGGAGGVVGAELVANAPKDGHTLLVVSLAITVNPWLYALPYDHAKAWARGGARGHRAERDLGPSGPAVQVGEGSYRRGEEAAGQAAIRLVGRRHLPASRAGAVQAHGRRRHPAHPLQRRGAGDDRRDRRPHPDGVRLRSPPPSRICAPASCARSASAPQRAARRCRMCRRCRNPDCPATRPPTGSASSRPPERRPRSSKNSRRRFR